MFYVKKGSIERVPDTSFSDKVSYEIGKDAWSLEVIDGVETLVPHRALDSFEIPKWVPDELLETAIVAHIREVIARDVDEEVSFVTKFSWA